VCMSARVSAFLRAWSPKAYIATFFLSRKNSSTVV